MKTAINTTMTTLLLTAALVGCGGSATLVRRDQGAGEVALQGAFMPAMADARLQMAEYCHGRFDATEQSDRVDFQCKSRSFQRIDDTQPALASNQRHPR